MSYRGSKKGSYGIRKAQRIHARRSPRAKHIDEHLNAPMAKSFEQWNAQPNRFDLPNVDTPKKNIETKREQQQQDKPFEPRPISHREFKQRLAMHRVMGVTH